ncbi:uncharacterized protein LOC131663585 [Phymastichus coffea]|uniref:uncharacterized protein LOC131663585 n=1 Tax=Phymastichus coffea TaxID=108790 RepID=UPI00273C07A6|nr:uncharacterized protein LOC131663585 [Phymastichus coffea]
MDYPAPRSIEHLRTCLGMVGWYAKFIENESDIKVLLTKLLGKDEPWVWGGEQQEAFERLKKSLTEAPVLANPDLGTKFPGMSDTKLKKGNFDRPQIRTLFADQYFVTRMNETEKKAWISFKAVAQNFLGNQKSDQSQILVNKLLENYQKLGCLMNLKLYFLQSHLDYFSVNLGDYTEEQGERFHQDIQEMKRRYQGRWDIT